MALSEETVQDKIEVVGDHRIVQVVLQELLKAMELKSVGLSVDIL